MIIGLDVGGTHTDVVLLGEEGVLRQVKVPTNPANLLDTVWTGLQEVKAGIHPKELDRIVLSTTLTTNAIVEGKLVPVGVIVSSGPGIDPEAFRIGDHYHVISGSIDHRGREIQPINVSEIESITSRLKKQGVRYVAVVSKFSVRNPKHELQIQETLGDDFEFVVLGHRISGNLNFPRRIATAYLNAAVYPIHKRFFNAVRQSLSTDGLAIPIHVLKADGGTMNMDASLQYPGQSILSGPAASVMGSLPFVQDAEETLVLDVGGTTTDMAVLIRDAPLLDPVGIEVARYRTLIRSLKTVSIGMGGDSAVSVAGGGLRVGPERMGRAMAYGGSVPTPTDALFVLAKDDRGDVDAARRGLEPIAAALGKSLEETAQLVFDTACHRILQAAHQMIQEINGKPVYTVHELLEGYKVNPKSILVLGGPAPFVASRLRELSDYKVRTVPRWEVANAVGAAIARTTCELTLFADTERGIATAPEEDFYQPVKSDFTMEKAVALAKELLRDKALREGADPDDLEMEIIEQQQFNMVRGFYTTGRNLRVKVQVKPGLIRHSRTITQKLNEDLTAAGTGTTGVAG
ncbi:hydantoinase/oxoprolinase family protein [Desulfoglaeba alkanexedens]|uniref:Hydantoinase/oxoprolinase family protein n=1 Tax=Desulfoglaeba alkanexedens ALDC TaxID=980445 RepID=A0A4P8L4I9_9BACT|nr:hydantoinase/oxoprolinase family protein [Desulfoglaeba alkanexedens]QCQ22839.1 hydantoinase/oxoprolinase family protein [Desulfoglaeba alkanexedens ALDC]